ncbi:MAG: hypothetical protein ACPHCX_05225, partial [Candidatus Puniceispirillaceae bacterium]
VIASIIFINPVLKNRVSSRTMLNATAFVSFTRRGCGDFFHFSSVSALKAGPWSGFLTLILSA